MYQLKYLVTIFVFITFYNNCINGQLSNVRLVNHLDYVMDVVHETLKTIEERGWSTFSVPDTSQTVNETVFDSEILGTISYTNGFLVRVQHLNIVQHTVQQVWNRTFLGRVDVQARLQMHNVAIGFDVLANLNNQNYHYTAMYTHPLVTYDFSILKDLTDDSLSVNINGNTPNSNNLVRYLPRDNITDVLTTLYDRSLTFPGVNDWGPEIFTPIVTDIVHNKIEFPRVCYNCPV